MMQRGEIRQKYGLKGNGCTDCLMACCCTPCDLTQQDKEVQTREGEKQAFISQQPGHVESMNYGAPQQAPVKHEYSPAPAYGSHNGAPNGAPQQYTAQQPYGA